MLVDAKFYCSFIHILGYNKSSYSYYNSLFVWGSWLAIIKQLLFSSLATFCG